MDERNEFYPYATERDAEEAYRDTLDECYGDVEICGLTYSASVALERVDPIAFRVGFSDWMDMERENAEALAA